MLNHFTPSAPCPCGTTLPYRGCCQPIHHDHRQALLPIQLMRARYSAHVLQLVDFVINTYHPSCHAEAQRAEIVDSINNQWLRLKVMDNSLNMTENEGFVHFKAWFKHNGKAICMEEKSRFIKEGELWFYIDGTFPTS